MSRQVEGKIIFGFDS